jgi:putative endonuclease
MSWYVYILRCADNTLYTGITTNPEKRLHQHNHEKTGAKYTRTRRPVHQEALFTVENRSVASKLEYTIKKLTRDQKENLIIDPDTHKKLL